MGTVNIFLGGTGKHVAEDIQDSHDFDSLAISEPIAFDLNARIRDGVELKLVAPGGDTASDVAALANSWLMRDPGPGIGPAANEREPGPQYSPENSLLVKIAQGITRDTTPSEGLFALRAHGLAVFSMLFGQGMAGGGAGNELRSHIAARVDSESFDGPPRINLITSTAGGTGAGTVIPLSLWLRQNYPQSQLNLVAVTPSAFTRELRNSRDLEELAAKGLSGTYAILRELSFFSEAPDPQTTFSLRGLPVTPRGLAYRPGRQMFNNVFWFGGRGGPKEDAFEEAGVLVRLLSHDASARDLAAETRANAMRWVGAVTAIEYPKLRYKRRMISGVLQEAYGRLRNARERFDGEYESTTTLLDYVDDTTSRALGGWFNTNRQGAMRIRGGATTIDRVAADDLAVRISSGAETQPYLGLPRGTERPGDNYYSESVREWPRYTGAVIEDLDRVAARRHEALQRQIRTMRRAEERAFGDWLSMEVLERRLSGDEPVPTKDLERVLQQLDSNADELDKHFEDDLLPGEKTIDACESEIRLAKERFDTPTDVKTSLSWGERAALFIGIPAIVLLGAVAITVLSRGVGLADLDAILGIFSSAIALAQVFLPAGIALIGAAFLSRRRLRERAAKGVTRDVRQLAAARGRAENRLFEAYEHRDRVLALRWMHQELRGRDGGISFFRELRQQIEAASNVVKRLDEAYAALEAKASHDVEQATGNPPHVHAEVGECIIVDREVAEPVVRYLHQRLKVDAQSGPEPRVRSLTLRLVHIDGSEGSFFDPVAATVSQILQAVEGSDQQGLRDAERIESRWRESAWDLIYWRLGENFPETFVDALTYCERSPDTALAMKVDGVSLPRRPSVDLNNGDDQPARRRVYVGSDAIDAAFNRAMRAPELSATKRALISTYESPRVLPTLGHQIVFLDLWEDHDPPEWAPSVIGNAVDAGNALRTYYAATDDNVPRVATAAETCFTVIPELLAATKIELGGNVKPLSLAVVVRLLGSDLDTRGPTYAELFYLVRARKWLTTQHEGKGQDAQVVTSIAESGEGTSSPLKLVAWRRGGLDDGTMFGAGRETVVTFDAFCELMRFTGTPMIAGATEGGYQYSGAELFTPEWARQPARVAALQRAIVREWYESANGIDADCAEMIAVLEGDLARMNDTPATESWERAMRRLLDGPERRRIRLTNLDPPSG